MIIVVGLVVVVVKITTCWLNIVAIDLCSAAGRVCVVVSIINVLPDLVVSAGVPVVIAVSVVVVIAIVVYVVAIVVVELVSVVMVITIVVVVVVVFVVGVFVVLDVVFVFIAVVVSIIGAPVIIVSVVIFIVVYVVIIIGSASIITVAKFMYFSISALHYLFLECSIMSIISSPVMAPNFSPADCTPTLCGIFFPVFFNRAMPRFNIFFLVFINCAMPRFNIYGRCISQFVQQTGDGHRWGQISSIIFQGADSPRKFLQLVHDFLSQ